MNSSPRHPAPLSGVTLRRMRYAPDERQDLHHHDRTSLTLVFDGSLDEVVGGAREDAGPLSVVYKPAGTEHANRIGSRGAVTLQIEFEPGFLGPVSGAATPSDWGWAHGGMPARRFLTLFADWTRGPLTATELEGYVFDILAALEEDEARAGRHAPCWLLHVVEELEDTYRTPRRVRDLADDAAVHPVALARAHRRHFGCSITDRLRARRVREAAGMLGAAEGSLSAVAFAAGFSDQSHLTRVFKRETGKTPGGYQTLVRE